MTANQTSAPITSSSFICEQCGDVAAAVPCPSHPDEPLLDLASPGMREYLGELDDRARRRTFGRWTTGGVVLGGLLAVAGPIAATGALEIDLVLTAVAAASGAACGRAVASARFRPRFADWSTS